MKEDWKPIPGFDGWYEISTLGRVRSWRIAAPGVKVRRTEPKMLHPKIYTDQSSGLDTPLRITLAKTDGGQRCFYIRNLMWDTFVGNRNGKMVVNINGDPWDCSLSNLALSKHGSPGNSRPVRKLDAATGEEICVYGSVKEAAEKEWWDPQTIRNRIRRKLERDGVRFEYAKEELLYAHSI